MIQIANPSFDSVFKFLMADWNMEEREALGRAQGVPEGIELGVQQGLEQGRKEQALKTACALKAIGLSFLQIEQVTGLSLSEIEAL